MRTIFWTSVALVVYTYVVYPAVLLILSKTRGRRRQYDGKQFPYVTMLVAAYNEEKVIFDKIRNFRELDYPRDRIELVFGTDGCTDRTDELLSSVSDSNVRHISFGVRRGKASVLNDLVDRARGEILLFSDANTMYKSDAVRKLVEPFSDPKIGGVCGKLRLLSDRESVAAVGEMGYWEIENKLKEMEGEVRTIFGATGGIYAIRKSLYQPLPTDRMVNDDFVVAMAVVEAGYDVVYQKDALAYEQALHSVSQEYRRKIRIGAGNVYSMVRFFHLLNPKRGFVAFGLFSHKYLRWLLPFWMLILLGSNLFLLGNTLYQLTLAAQLVFYGASGLGYLAAIFGWQMRVFTYPFWFFLLNLGLLIGAVRYILGLQRPTWTKGRD